MDIPSNTQYLLVLLEEHGVTNSQVKWRLVEELKRYDPSKRPYKIKYDRYLESGHWLKFRLYMPHEYPECVFCDCEEALLVHHSNYDHLGKEDEYRDVIVLCGECHEAFHTFANLFVDRKYREKFLYPRAGSFLDEDNRFKYGKHKGESLSRVRSIDPGYVDWVYGETKYESDREAIEEPDYGDFDNY